MPLLVNDCVNESSQPTNLVSHPKIAVKKKLFLVVSVGLLAFFVLTSGWFRFFLNVALLHAKTPDQKLSMPVLGVSKTGIADSWHAPRDGERLHEGQDIFAPRGTPVLSATDGYVVRVAENKLGGQTVSVIGAGGRIYYYAHMDSYAPNIATGDQVTTQTVLGYVGTTGNAAGTPPHLHFGVYARGGALNPLPLLNDRPEPKPERKEEPVNKRRR
jgi:peptidoglycan LD-endopeptidase LytH